MTPRILFASCLAGLASACSAAVPSGGDHADEEVTASPSAALSVFVTPSAEGHAPVVRAFKGAKHSIVMTMFHLTDETVVAALVEAAGRKVSVRLVLDAGNADLPSSRPILAELENAGVEIRKSSTAFAITHEKAFVIDGTTAYITSMNLTNMASTTRDFGLVTKAPDVVGDVLALFAADWANALDGGSVTPTPKSPDIVISPTNSGAKLTGLVASAHEDITLTVENLGDADIEGALEEAAQSRHVRVRVIVPMCDINPKSPLVNYPSLAKLAAAGVATRVMPFPASSDRPYMHAKTIVVDGKRAYVGSVNFSSHSIEQARELGLLFDDASVIATMHSTFEADWSVSVAPPTNPGPSLCPAS
jgi:phosphatidylserine/phosphatidylglycerophosphate/cardiolipin synthase-like enzyme